MLNKALFLFGPTASGKTEIAIKLAKEFNGEIVNMDSVQVYKDFNVGSAKPTKQELAQVAHYLIDIENPENQLNSFEIFQKSLFAGQQIIKKNKIPIFSGGTGLYFKALLFGLFSGPNQDPEIRKQIFNTKEEKGLSFLYEQLKEVDKEAALRINQNDYLRIERALEVYYLTGKTITQLRLEQSYTSPYNFVKIALSYPREELYKRIEHRVDLMFENGLVEEVENLMIKYANASILNKAIGYKEVVAYLQNKIDFETMKHLIKRNSRRFAKRQLTLFKALPDVNWFIPPDYSKIENFAKKQLKGYIE